MICLVDRKMHDRFFRNALFSDSFAPTRRITSLNERAGTRPAPTLRTNVDAENRCRCGVAQLQRHTIVRLYGGCRAIAVF